MMKKITSLICAAVLLTGTFPQYAIPAVTANASTTNNEISFDSPYAKITSFANHMSDTIVINIQDYHGDYATQIAISKLLERIYNSGKKTEIYLEGAYKEVDLSYLENSKNIAGYNEFTDMLLRTGKITGAEFFGLKNKKIKLNGLEDKELYLKNFETLSYLIANRENALLSFNIFYNKAEKSILKDFDKNKKKLIKARKRHEAGKMGHEKYIKALLKYSGETLSTVKNKYPNIYHTVSLYSLKEEINLKKANSEMLMFKTFLQKELPYKEYVRIENAEDRMYLLGQIYKNYSFQTAELTKFFKYTGFQNSLNSAALVKEESDMFWDILQKGKSIQRQGAQYLRILDYSGKLINGSVLSYEYDHLVKNDGLFRSVFFKYTGAGLPADAEIYYNLSKEFYDINGQRNGVFIEKAGLKKNENKKTAANDVSRAFANASTVKVLITGGYHSEGLAGLLDDSGISYMVFTPNISAVDKETQPLYENTIKLQSEIIFSAFQKFLNMIDILVVNGDLDFKKFCANFLDYDTVNFFLSRGNEGEKQLEEYINAFAGQINEFLPDDSKIKDINVQIIKQNSKNYTLVAAKKKEDGNVVINVDSVSHHFKKLSFLDKTKRKFFLKTPGAASRKKSENTRFSFEAYKWKIITCRKSLDTMLAFCIRNRDTGDLEQIAPEILKDVSALIETMGRVDSVFSRFGFFQKNEIQDEIFAAISKYEEILSSGFNFGSKNKSIAKAYERLKKTSAFFGAASPAGALFEYDAESIAQSPERERLELAVIADKTAEYLSGNADTELPIFAYAAQAAHKKYKNMFSYNAADMIFLELKNTLFRGEIMSNKNVAERAVNAMSFQREEILPYFMQKQFSVENREETESALIRSIIALDVLSDISGPEYAVKAIEMSENLFSVMHDSIGIKDSENAYLDALNSGKDPARIEELKKVMDDKIDYARRITIFQNELLKIIEQYGKKYPSVRDAARDHLIKAAKGEMLDGKAGMEGIYWVKQQAIFRLKSFYSLETVEALNDILKAENEGFMSSADSIFVSINLEASNTKTLSLKLHAASVLIDLKRQEALELLKNDMSSFFESLEKVAAKDRFAYILAAAEYTSSIYTSSKDKAALFRGFAACGNKDIIFASNILVDLAAKEYAALKAKADYRSDIIGYIEAFARNTGNFCDADLSGVLAKISDVKNGKSFNVVKDLNESVESIHNILSSMGSVSSKRADWISDYSVFLLSGGGVTEEILKLDSLSFDGKAAGVRSPNDDSGSSMICRGVNAEKNGIYSIAQGDIVTYITAAAALDSEGNPLKGIISDLMNTRFEENTSLSVALNGLKDEARAAVSAEAKEEFDVFWKKLMFYAGICDLAGFSAEGNSLKNLIFEAMAIDNRAYGEGFINPDGLYSATKDFADLLGTKSVAVSNHPYGNITTVTTNGGIEFIGQSYFSHTPHGTEHRDFWTPRDMGEVFEKVPYESRPAKALSNADVVIAGLCSWLTSLGVQLANQDISEALASNDKADKILITNPVKDDENLMSWRDSSVSFIERVSKQNFKKMFGTVFGWRSLAKNVKVENSNLTEIDVFEGKAGGYRGENEISISGMRLLDKLGVKYRVISGGISIGSVPRRDDKTKTNFKIKARPLRLASEIRGALSKTNRELFAPDSTVNKNELTGSRFSGATALFFDDGKGGALNRAEQLLEHNTDSFVFVPVSKAAAAVIKANKEALPLEAFENLKDIASMGLDAELLFAVSGTEEASKTICYYIDTDDGTQKAAAEQVLAQWFAQEAPSLAVNGLIKNEKISMIESSNAESDFGSAGIEDSPMKVLVSESANTGNYDCVLTSYEDVRFEEYISFVLDEFSKPVHDIAYRLSGFAGMDFSDLQNERQLRRLKGLLVSIGAWDDVKKRSAILYALKYKVKIKVAANRITFINDKGVTLAFGIDAAGRFHATNSFLRRMEVLENLRIFADMDDNLAPRENPFGEKMKKIFADLTLYGICNPIIITGNTDQTIMVRLKELPESILETMSFYTEVGGMRFVYGEYIDESGNTRRGFVTDNYYLDEISKARVPTDLRNRIRKITANIDYMFDDLYTSFVRKTEKSKNYRSAAVTALESYGEENKMLRVVEALAGVSGKEALIENWGNLDVSEVKAVLYALMKTQMDGRELGQAFSEEEFLEAAKIISLLEYSRISYSEDENDRKNKSVLTDAKAKIQILNDDYKKLEADSPVRVSLSPVRVSHVKDILATFYEFKINDIEDLREFKVESSGRTTINIMKRICQKTLPINYELFLGIPAKNFMYSGDEVFLDSADGSESHKGIDDSVALFGLQAGNEEMFVASTNLMRPSNKRPNLMWVSEVMKRNGLSVESTVDAGVFLHEKILERLEYNIGEIAADRAFKPENIVQLLKETLEGDSVEFNAGYDFFEFIRDTSNSDFSTYTKDILAAA